MLQLWVAPLNSAPTLPRGLPGWTGDGWYTTTSQLPLRVRLYCYAALLPAILPLIDPLFTFFSLVYHILFIFRPFLLCTFANGPVQVANPLIRLICHVLRLSVG